MKAKDFDAKFDASKNVLDALDLSKTHRPNRVKTHENHDLKPTEWLKENHQAISTYNKRIEKRGPALSTYRRF